MDERVGHVIRLAREANGLSQAALGRAAGIPQSHVAKIEAGTDARFSTLNRVAKAVGIVIKIEPDIRRLFERPPEGSAFAAARDFGVDMSDLYERYLMSPTERLQRAVANSRGLGKLLK